MRHVLFIAPLVLFLGCAHEHKMVTTTSTETATQQPAAAQNITPPAQAVVTPAPKTCSADTDCTDRQLCIASSCTDITQNLSECNLVRVHFDFDKSDIKQTEVAQLDRMARCLKADRAMHVAIEGNADERGTQDYNLALGDRRATSVANYLENLGVSTAQLKTVSYGKENPLCVAHDEDCWAKNRRAAVKSTNMASRKGPSRQ